jgi:hypothetical protein
LKYTRGFLSRSVQPAAFSVLSSLFSESKQKRVVAFAMSLTESCYPMTGACSMSILRSLAENTNRLRGCLDRAPASPAKIGTPNIWRWISPPGSSQRAGTETEGGDQNIGVVAILWL